MNGYPKMKKLLRSRSSTKSRSMDFADLLMSFPQTPSKNTQNPTISKIKTKTKNPCPITKTHHDLFVSEPDYEDGRNIVKVNSGKIFGGVLRRNSSVTSASSSSSSSLQSAVKKAFSMRRSSSVSERYCRIHDQSATASFLQSPPPNFNNIDDVDDDDDDEDDHEAMDVAAGSSGAMQPRSMDKKMKNKNRNGKIFKACKRLFGL